MSKTKVKPEDERVVEMARLHLEESEAWAAYGDAVRKGHSKQRCKYLYEHARKLMEAVKAAEPPTPPPKASKSKVPAKGYKS